MHLHPVPFRIPAPPPSDEAIYEFFEREALFTGAILTYLVLGHAYVDFPNTGLEGVGRYLLEPHGL